MQKFLLHLFITVCFSSFVLVQCPPLASSCYPCSNSLHRGWIRESCDGTSADCGQCLEGYSGGIDGPCEPLSIINVNESTIAFVPSGATVNLECIFNQSMLECVWERRGYDVEISGRYHWRNQGDSGIIDCSMSITGFKEIDVGEWRCSSAATANTYSIPNINPYLNMIKGNTVTVHHNSEASFPVGESVILKCFFEQEVDCAWERSHIAIVVSDRYQYTRDNTNGMNTKDCSIQINNITEIDFSRWDCKSMAHGLTNAMLKSAVWLSKAKPTSKTDVHSNTSTSQKPSIEAVPHPADTVNQPNNGLGRWQNDCTIEYHIGPNCNCTTIVAEVVILLLALILNIMCIMILGSKSIKTKLRPSLEKKKGTGA